MPGSPATTTRHGLPRYGGSDAANFPTAVNALADAIDESAPSVIEADVLSSRPAASLAERLYFATDIKVLFRDTGSAWVSIQGSMTGTFASRPAAAAVGAGATYFATDVAVEYVSSGSAWIRNGTASGSLIPTAAISTPTGFVLADGSTLDSVANPEYADLFSAIGTTHGGTGASSFNVPDMRGRTAIGSGTGTSLTARTLGATGGAETHTLTSGEIPSHTHSGTTGTEGSHTHTGTTNNESSHTHSVTVANESAHTHPASASTTGSHDHGGATGYYDTDHYHNFDGNVAVYGQAYSGSSGIATRATGSYNMHGHYSTSWASDYASMNHVHSIMAQGNHTHTVTTSATSHTHSATAGTGSAHSHGFTTGAGAAHSHSFTSSTDSTGGGSHTNMQPFGVATYLVKL
ncbi:Phage tail collar domain containing protein [uncultured Caudovirales phage]|uniref:Phage tail collar domain containing protein n=1 Tax=uncultured Caudovirales phage TaxID=2100421 RepID=A0A6J5RTH1_9CAUD|nr:Phage tail collar domain containing protein [uncultured Caudovirales phage]